MMFRDGNYLKSDKFSYIKLAPKLTAMLVGLLGWKDKTFVCFENIPRDNIC